ncbi:S-layer homology domain-containing protein [Romeria aff. gracilis LEGE 07310]|uniref:S-layer homology domain-containing protein n=1 Tax=Vasconcelosia minhoensis LEGE 07310 TaxID=915328 RepID=A0A8J7AUP8_9CYAN|nr:S-layer homology domain-containing protein [Romeria gracilis]MBE9079689.1 S-layer homology domain-containing protein [Romeria aff. gracilis LEGE 07310]
MTAQWLFGPRSLLGLVLLTSLLVTACEGSRLGDSVGQTLEPDPQLAENSDGSGNSSGTENGTATVADTSEDSTDTAAGSMAQTDDEVPQPGDPNFIGPVLEGETASVAKTPSGSSTYSDLNQAPDELQPYLQDLAALNLLKVKPPSGDAASETASDEFKPNQAITRREYARWLFAANNRFYQDQTSKKIRQGIISSPPAFQDVPTSDPDFGIIQGLAEAGIIPSSLSGSSTSVSFRPDAPLTREALLLWKVPLDTRQTLPQATVQAVQETWGFQDAAKIEPRALQAVLADYSNGDFANIRRAFGYTTLFQPSKAATRAESAATLWRFGNSTEGVTAEELLKGTQAKSVDKNQTSDSANQPADEAEATPNQQ